ncbi:MAG: DsbA family oxidoreductase [Actinomycetes bacterium]
MRIEIWSDVVCPWCYIGKRRLEKALAQFPHRDEVEVTWRSFQLDPSTPKTWAGGRPGTTERLAEKYGVSVAEADAMQQRVAEVAAADGLDYRLDDALPANTIDAHRLLHFAADRGRQDQLKERLLAAYFVEGRDVADHDTLASLAAEVGLPHDEAATVLRDPSRYETAVADDIAQAREFGAGGVPFFVFDRRFAVSGAQPVEVFTQALTAAWDAAHPAGLQVMPGADGAPVCDDDSCAV